MHGACILTFTIRRYLLVERKKNSSLDFSGIVIIFIHVFEEQSRAEQCGVEHRKKAQKKKKIVWEHKQAEKKENLQDTNTAVSYFK